MIFILNFILSSGILSDTGGVMQCVKGNFYKLYHHKSEVLKDKARFSQSGPDCEFFKNFAERTVKSVEKFYLRKIQITVLYFFINFFPVIKFQRLK